MCKNYANYSHDVQRIPTPFLKIACGCEPVNRLIQVQAGGLIEIYRRLSLALKWLGGRLSTTFYKINTNPKDRFEITLHMEILVRYN
jgi:hypothetical protein